MGPFNQAEDLTLQAISAECIKARHKFPNNRLLLAALMEEVGELARALLQGKPKDEIDKEAIQVASVAVRIIEEGDATFDNVPESARKP
jgi:NTP pyrophosphatase (non-canonical NTP hydrolase)